MKLSTLYENTMKTVVLAVHPNYVVDAAAAASSKYGNQPEKHGPNRLKILINYVNQFKTYISDQLRAGSTIVITLMGEPYQLKNWHDPKSHWEQTNKEKQEAEQEQVIRIHQDLMDFIDKIGQHPNVHIVSEDAAGDACKNGELNNILSNANQMFIIGGNLTGCLSNTLKALSTTMNKLNVEVLEKLTFDDDPKFWSRDH